MTDNKKWVITSILVALILFGSGSMHYQSQRKPSVPAVSYSEPTENTPTPEELPIETGAVLGAFDLALQTPTTTCNKNTSVIELAWKYESKNTTYQIQRQKDKSNWITVGNIHDQYTFIDKISVASPKTYNYRIFMRNGNVKKYSNTQSIPLPDCRTKAKQPSATPQSSVTPNTNIVSKSVTKKLKWGAYTGWKDTDLAAFERLVGKPVDYQALFIGWGTYGSFPKSIANTLKGTSKTLVIFWEPYDSNVLNYNQPYYSYDSILSGTHDTYIKSFIASAQAYGGPVILVPFAEMNGEWNPWSGTVNGNTPQKSKQSFCYLQSFLRDASNIKLGWAPNSTSVPDSPENSIQSYYPGSCVDIIGVDGFNFDNPWMTFDEIFGKPLSQIKNYPQPIIIFSTASAEGARKAKWITDALTVQIPKHPNIVGWIWFNLNKEKDWRVNSDPASLQAFKNALP